MFFYVHFSFYTLYSIQSRLNYDGARQDGNVVQQTFNMQCLLDEMQDLQRPSGMAELNYTNTGLFLLTFSMKSYATCFMKRRKHYLWKVVYELWIMFRWSD